MHIDFQAGPDARVPQRVHGYNALLEDRHELPVRSAVVLLRPAADLRNLTGVYERGFPDEPAYLVFRYQVIRIWKVAAERLLAGEIGLLPLAPISSVTPAELPHIVDAMKRKLRKRSVAEAKDLWTAAYVLMELRYDPHLIDQVLQGVIAMEESVTYQAIIAKGKHEGVQEGRLEGLQTGREEGRVGEARKILLLQGRDRLGEPDASTRAALESVTDVQRVEQWILSLNKAGSWQELLAQRPRRRKPGR
jgi:hypothetical protein